MNIMSNNKERLILNTIYEYIVHTNDCSVENFINYISDIEQKFDLTKLLNSIFLPESKISYMTYFIYTFFHPSNLKYVDNKRKHAIIFDILISVYSDDVMIIKNKILNLIFIYNKEYIDKQFELWNDKQFIFDWRHTNNITNVLTFNKLL